MSEDHDDRYTTQPLPSYAVNTFRNVDRHYKSKKVSATSHQLVPTDYSNVLDLRFPEKNKCPDASRVIRVATRQLSHPDKKGEEFTWKWEVDQGFNQSWGFEPSLNPPHTGDGLPPWVHTQTRPPENTTTTSGSDGTASTGDNTNTAGQNRGKRGKKVPNHVKYPYCTYAADTVSNSSGGASSIIYAVDNVPGLFVISRAISYAEQILWALRCFVEFDQEYTNLYNLHFVLPEKDHDHELETVPDQENVPEDLQVRTPDDIRHLFLKACYSAFYSSPPPSPPPPSHSTDCHQTESESTPINHDAPEPSATAPSLLHSVIFRSHRDSPDSVPTSTQSPSAPTVSTPPPDEEPIVIDSIDSFHNPSHFDLRRLKTLRWASLGYHYDWTLRQYTDDNQSPFPSELSSISQQVIQPLVDYGLVTPLTPEAAIINYYPAGSRMGAHIDDAEPAVLCPIVSFSVGLTAVFAVGSKSRKDEPITLFLRSGDVLIQDGKSRLAFHSVPRIVEDSLPLEALLQACHSLLQIYYDNIDLFASKPISLDDTDIHVHIRETLSNINDSHKPFYISSETAKQFVLFVWSVTPLLSHYSISVEQLLTFVLHILCHYRLNFNSRQVVDPRFGRPSEVREKFPIDAVKSGIYEETPNL